jgi:hypothetical protein
MIEGGDIYTRRAAVDTSAGRSVLLDAIEINSNFNLGFYRELARGNHPEEGDMYRTHRWMSSTPPTVYIDNNALGTLDGVIEQSTINTVRDVVRDVIPVFTGKYYSSVTVKTGEFLDWGGWDDIPDNSVVFTFDDTIYFDPGAVGITLTEPDFISPSTSTINKTVIFVIDSSIFYELEGLDLETVIAHETGHGFGFRHTSLLPSIMWRRPENGRRYTDADRLHMAIMYKRVAGNTDIDNDPVSGAKMRGEAPGIQVHIDERTGEPKLSPEMLERLQTLRRHPLLKRYLNN